MSIELNIAYYIALFIKKVFKKNNKKFKMMKIKKKNFTLLRNL